MCTHVRATEMLLLLFYGDRDLPKTGNQKGNFVVITIGCRRDSSSSSSSGFFRKREIKKEISLSSQSVAVVTPFLICLFENEGREEPWEMLLLLLLLTHEEVLG